MKPKDIQTGKTYASGSGKTRTVLRIERNEVYYRTNTGKESHCWISTFATWAFGEA